MAMSKEILTVLVDLVENKLSCMQISDREDMREMALLQRSLSLLNGIAGMEGGYMEGMAAIPRRGRRRKLTHHEIQPQESRSAQG